MLRLYTFPTNTLDYLKDTFPTNILDYVRNIFPTDILDYVKDFPLPSYILPTFRALLLFTHFRGCDIFKLLR